MVGDRPIVAFKFGSDAEGWAASELYDGGMGEGVFNSADDAFIVDNSGSVNDAVFQAFVNDELVGPTGQVSSDDSGEDLLVFGELW